MPPGDHDERRVEIYFGPSPHTNLSKNEVGNFIVSEMGLRGPGGSPKWTEGITELIQLGMETFNESNIDNPEITNRINQLERKLDRYQGRIEQMRAAEGINSGPDEIVEAAKIVLRSEARILEVLCRDDNIGVKSPNFVDSMKLYEEIGISPEAISILTERMSKNEPEGFVETDRYGESIKATSPDSFRRYCNLYRLKVEEIRSINLDYK